MTTFAPARPTLESGDHLTRAEFHRRYCARPDIKRAELIEGVVYVPSPVRLARHGRPHVQLTAWLHAYASGKRGLDFADNTTLLLSDSTEVQPDLVLFRTGSGRTHMTDDDYLEGAPELVIEIAASSASYDLHDKYRAYEAAGVQEYLVWRTEDGAIDWFRLEDGSYTVLRPDAHGILHSVEFPGLALDARALLGPAGQGPKQAKRPSRRR